MPGSMTMSTGSDFPLMGPSWRPVLPPVRSRSGTCHPSSGGIRWRGIGNRLAQAHIKAAKRLAKDLELRLEDPDA